MNDTIHRNVTISDVVALSEIVNAASDHAKVAWIGDSGAIIYGTARHIVRSATDVGFLDNTEDVRDGCLRITSSTGMEHFPKVSHLMNLMARGEFSRYDW